MNIKNADWLDISNDEISILHSVYCREILYEFENSMSCELFY